jgi:hypothetical protein
MKREIDDEKPIYQERELTVKLWSKQAKARACAVPRGDANGER